MPMVLQRSTFLMIPRTATTWCRQAIRNAGVQYWETNPKHDTEVVQRVEKPLYVPEFRFTFTRNPDTWLRSRWVLGKWADELSEFWDIDYTKFRAAVDDREIERYFKKYTSRCKFVGKTETIADDLVTALRTAGEDFDETGLRETPPLNESPKEGDLIGSAYWAMKRDEMGRLPQDMLGRLPPQLIDRLPKDAIGNLPANVLVEMLRRATRDAVDAGTGAARNTRA